MARLDQLQHLGPGSTGAPLAFERLKDQLSSTNEIAATGCALCLITEMERICQQLLSPGSRMPFERVRHHRF